jgi:hypothetical protein
MRALLDAAAETVLAGDPPNDELHTARLRLAKRRMAEALVAMEEAGLRAGPAFKAERLE